MTLKIMTSLFKTTCRNMEIKANRESFICPGIEGGICEIIRKRSKTITVYGDRSEAAFCLDTRKIPAY